MDDRQDDLPYNPNREIDGRFGSGPHKQRPKVGREPAAIKPAGKGRPHGAADEHLGAARAAVAKAKADPTAKNIKAARTAVAKAKDPGAAKAAKPKSAPKAGAKPATKAAKTPKPKKAKFDDSAHKAKIAEHKAKEAHHRTESLKIVAKQKALREQAKGLHKSDKAGRAELKAQHKELGAKRDEHKAAATKARNDRIAESKAMQTAKKAHAVAQATGQHPTQSTVQQTAQHQPKSPLSSEPKKAPTPEQIHDLVANDKRRKYMQDTHELSNEERAADTKGRLDDNQFTNAAQYSIRAHNNDVFAAYGMHNNDRGKPGSYSLEVRTFEGMGGDALGLHYPISGVIAVPVSQAGHMLHHASLDSHGLKKLGKDYMAGDQSAHDTLDAYITVTHEALHGHGPDMADGRTHTMINELTTEMAAWKVAADVHGLHPHDIDGSYQNYITPTVNKLAELTGRSARDATAALADASIRHKQRSERDLSPTVAIHDVAGHALKQLGVTNASTHEALTKHMVDVATSQ